ncbi:hypothetical protein D515_03611 [Grimontia indica]|uniref:Uncharacterized protein n=1 Tax=Grimontia indica TaxID=1056512 RepID=R1IAA9_9GAMM|nr:hypothetical protein D515_03611 [Grimontia indica]
MVFGSASQLLGAGAPVRSNPTTLAKFEASAEMLGLFRIYCSLIQFNI